MNIFRFSGSKIPLHSLKYLTANLPPYHIINEELFLLQWISWWYPVQTNCFVWLHSSVRIVFFNSFAISKSSCYKIHEQNFKPQNQGKVKN